LGKHVTRPLVIIIAAVAHENLCIGYDTRLPWHIPEDMRRFKSLTYGYPLIMGRVTCEGLIRDFGGPLPGRQMLTLSRNADIEIHPDIQMCTSLMSALDSAKPAKKIFIAGGSKIYQESLSIADRLELTLVDGTYEGDTFFPEFKHLIGTHFQLTQEEFHPGFSFVTYDRIQTPEPQ